MKDNIWDVDCEEIVPQDLNEEEKKIAEYCSDIEMEFKEIISMIDNGQQ